MISGIASACNFVDIVCMHKTILLRGVKIHDFHWKKWKFPQWPFTSACVWPRTNRPDVCTGASYASGFILTGIL